jgi:hypothetical protein
MATPLLELDKRTEARSVPVRTKFSIYLQLLSQLSVRGFCKDDPRSFGYAETIIDVSFWTGVLARRHRLANYCAQASDSAVITLLIELKASHDFRQKPSSPLGLIDPYLD